MFVLVVLLLHGHVWGSIRVHLSWVRPCFSNSSSYSSLFVSNGTCCRSSIRMALALNNPQRPIWHQRKKQNHVLHTFVFKSLCTYKKNPYLFVIVTLPTDNNIKDLSMHKQYITNGRPHKQHVNQWVLFASVMWKLSYRLKLINTLTFEDPKLFSFFFFFFSLSTIQQVSYIQ